MTTGLSTSRIINVNVNLAPQAAQFANLKSLLILGNSDVIDVNERIRSYNGLSSVAADFGTSAPEYLAALPYFSQVPQPNDLKIGRWAQAATKGLLRGGVLTAGQQLLSLWTAVVSGGVNFVIDGVARNLSALNFSAQTNLNGVASVINTALGVNGSCTWDGSRFIVKSATTGAASTVAYATAGAGTDISTMLKMISGLASPPVAGIVAETAVAAVAIIDNMPQPFYGLMMASTSVVDADHLAIAAYIEAANNRHIYGVNMTATTALDSTITTDIGSLLVAAGYRRTFTQYCSSNPYAVSSMFGRELTVDFAQNNSVITLMFKTEPGITAENLTSSQADALITKRYNFYVNYDNNTAILQNAVMCGPVYIDEIHGTDAWANALQVNLWNALYQSATKIPQTDQGNHQLVTVAEATCAAYVNNGLLAPGTWTLNGFGNLKYGDFLDKGYYVYAAPVSTQAVADRGARKSMPIQIAGKLAGAIQSVGVLVNVNR